MGTSKGYKMPTGGDWTPLKTEATKFVKNEGRRDRHDNLLTGTAERIVGRYIRALGGARGVAGGGGQGGSRLGQTGIRTGIRLGAFLSDISTVGFDQALRNVGLGDLVGEGVANVIRSLLDAFTSESSSLDEEAARFACSELYVEIFEDAETYEDVGEKLTHFLDERGVAKILADFFAGYTYTLFCRDFYEEWQRKVGLQQAREKLIEIKDYVFARLNAQFIAPEVANINWNGPQGVTLVQRIMRETLFIFEIDL